MNDNEPIKILLVDDHALFRGGLRSLLQRQIDFDIVGEAADGLEGVKLASQLQPDVVLLDLDMPVMHGKDALAQILSYQPDMAVLMLTVSEDGADLADCMRGGARGYLLKNINAEFLIQAIGRAAAGESVMSEAMTTKLMEQFRLGGSPAVALPSEGDRLTPREREILTFLARGDSNKEIARSLALAESTVKIHVQNILKKLNLSSRVQAAVFAVEHGLA